MLLARAMCRQRAAAQDDVLVKGGGMVAVPAAESGAQFNFDFGFAAGMDCGGVDKTMVLTLKGRHRSFTLGKRINRTQVDAIAALAARHGSCRAGFRSGEKPVTEAWSSA